MLDGRYQWRHYVLEAWTADESRVLGSVEVGPTPWFSLPEPPCPCSFHLRAIP